MHEVSKKNTFSSSQPGRTAQRDTGVLNTAFDRIHHVPLKADGNASDSLFNPTSTFGPR